MKKVRIEDICLKVSSGGTPSRANPDYYSSNGNLWVKSKELLENGIYDTEEKITDLAIKNSSAKYYPENTILLAMYGANVGQLAWLVKPATVNQAICAMVPDSTKVNYKYFYYNLLVNRSELTTQAHGAAQQNLNAGLVKNFELLIPPLDEQERIANLLSNYDNLIENNNRRIAILEEMAQSLYREWFVNFRYPNHQDNLDADGKPKLTNSPLGQIPEGWEMKALGELVDFKRKSAKKGRVPEHTPYMGLEHFPRKSIALSDWEEVSEIGSDKLVFKRGDILFGKIRPNFHKVGVAQVDGLCSSDTFVLSPKEPIHHSLIAMVTFSNEFVAQAVQTAQGSKMPRASWDVLQDFTVFVPDADTLKRFNSLVAPAIEQIRVLSLKNRNLKQQRDMLLPKLISGQIELKE